MQRRGPSEKQWMSICRGTNRWTAISRNVPKVLLLSFAYMRYDDIRCNIYYCKKIRRLWLEPLPATPGIPSVLHRQGGRVVYGASRARVRQDGTKASIHAG